MKRALYIDPNDSLQEATPEELLTISQTLAQNLLQTGVPQGFTSRLATMTVGNLREFTRSMVTMYFIVNPDQSNMIVASGTGYPQTPSNITTQVIGSRSRPDVSHVVTLDDGEAVSCTCEAFTFRPETACRHMIEAESR